MERLRRGARHRPDRAFRHNAPGVCPVCEDWIESALDVHMTNVHLDMAQLGRCPVEWSAVWKGSVRACQEHLSENHGGSSLFDLKNVAKFFPPWTVSCHVWQTALRPDVSGVAVDARLFHEAGCRLMHRYRVYKDPFPHPATPGWCHPSPPVLCVPGHGHHPAHSPADLCSGVGSATWPCPS